MMNIKVLVLLLFSASICIGREEDRHEPDDPDMFDYKNHPCRRNCSESREAKLCRYTFVVERYTTMSKACYDCPNKISDCLRPHCVAADGVPKMIYTINRQMPGPIIEVCRNDDILVEVRNKMLSESTTIHWHGFKHFRNYDDSAVMDGVPYVTQCPILPGQYFFYKFRADQIGTFFYRGHIGTQRADGLFGAMIVHNQTEKGIVKFLNIYDEHIVMVNDWSHKTVEESIMMDLHNGKPMQIDTLLANGLGRRQFMGNGYNNTTPTDVFTVRQGKNYRFRVIAAGFGNCPIRMTIDKHQMIVISLDSNDIKHVIVDAITIWPGERTDVVLMANQTAGNYWIRFVGDIDCKPNGHHLAVLRYDTVGLSTPEGSEDPREIVTDHTPIRILNAYYDAYDKETRDIQNINVTELISMVPTHPALEEKNADVKFYIPLDFYPLDNHDYHRKNLYSFTQVPHDKRSPTPQMSHMSMVMPSEPLMLQGPKLNKSTFCRESSAPWDVDCEGKHCQCTKMLYVNVGSVVELILVDEGGQFEVNHTLYLHGHFFRVLAWESLTGTIDVRRVAEMDRSGQIKRNLFPTPLKDITTTPAGGYTVIRFHAVNPGYWLFHSQIEPHNIQGMALIFQVGEYSQFPRVWNDFPRCDLRYFKKHD